MEICWAEGFMYSGSRICTWIVGGRLDISVGRDYE